MSVQYRQGDYLLIAVAPVDKSFMTKEDHPSGEVIIGHGEKSGHTHRVMSYAAEAWRGSGGNRILSLQEPADLTHDEHGAISLPEGDYKIVQQREWTADKARVVQD